MQTNKLIQWLMYIQQSCKLEYENLIYLGLFLFQVAKMVYPKYNLKINYYSHISIKFNVQE